MENNKKIILVTGGAGFIGSHLIERLVADPDNQVISLDNYFTGKTENHIPGAEYRKGHTKDIETLVPEKPDIIYHLGEYSRVFKSMEEPYLVWDLNMDGTFGVLEFWRKHGGKLVYAGSSTKSASPRPSDSVLGRDLSMYTWTKAANSELVANYGRWFNLPYAITYFYNVYGPGERDDINHYGTVIEIFKQKFLHGEPFPVKSPGTQTRAFTHVEDTVSGILLAGEKGEGDEFGICSKETFSLLDVARMFGGEVEMLPPTPSTRSVEAIDPVKIKALGWKQEHTLPEYIEKIKKTKH
ncbi:MAG: NAD-dependent epimerase/dehydratase family protein [Candidatus Parcubacteria bacterium]|nr:NAD-dependent epimerase/dehydratase family protein [Candidatus Parcubacteria bacterium]